MKKSIARKGLRTLTLATLDDVTGGFEDGLRAEGFRLYQSQGDLREYCRPAPPNGQGRSCILGVVRDGKFRQGIGEEDFRRNEREPFMRAIPGGSWGDR